jgi:hypothetical protein
MCGWAGKQDGNEGAIQLRRFLDIPVVFLTVQGDEGTQAQPKRPIQPRISTSRCIRKSSPQSKKRWASLTDLVGFPLLAHFPPKHHCQSSGDKRSEHAYPHRNNHAIQGDFPTSKKAKNVRDGNQPEEDSGDKGERLHIFPVLSQTSSEFARSCNALEWLVPIEIWFRAYQ